MAFNTNLQQYINANDFKGASDSVLKELGKVLAKNKSEFVYLLNSSDVPVTMSMSNENLVEAFVSNAKGNKKLLLGAAYLVNHHNKQLSFDGDETVNDTAVKNSYALLYHQFEGAYVDEKLNLDADNKDNEAKGYAKSQMLEAEPKLSLEGKVDPGKTKKAIIIGVVALAAIGLGIFAYYKFKK
jgi:hypothetical protein